MGKDALVGSVKVLPWGTGIQSNAEIRSASRKWKGTNSCIVLSFLAPRSCFFWRKPERKERRI